MKYFLKLFLTVIVSEILLRLLIIVLQLDVMPKPIHLLGSILSVLSSLPLSLIDRSFPYWAMGSLQFTFSLVLITWFIHTVIVFLFVQLIKTFDRQD